MTKRNSTAVTPAVYTRELGPKPEKPARSFTDKDAPYPLTVHPAGYFSKKIRGKVWYIARWEEGAEVAEQKWNAVKDDRLAGRQPKAETDEDAGLTVRKLLNEYLNYKRREMERNGITRRTFLDCERVCEFLAKQLDRTRMVSDLGKRDFSKLLDVMLAQKRKGKTKSLVVLGNEITRIKSVFNFAVKQGMLARPVVFGMEFSKPKAKAIEEQSAATIEEHGERTYTREEILAMLGAASQPLKSMILLGINAGLGNSDVGQLRLSCLNLETGWLIFPRPKNQKPRKCHLWPETVAALKEWLPQRPEPKNPADAKLVYITKSGQSWHKEAFENPLSHEMRKLLDGLDINGGRGFYHLRHTYRTEAGACCDQEATYYTMGHALPGMGKNYVQRIHDERLVKVAETVHAWLYPSPAKKSSK